MKLISRNRAIEDQDFASFIRGWQNIGNPGDEPVPEEGEYFDEASDKIRFFSQSELNKSHQKEIDDFKLLLDDKPTVESTVFATIVIDTPDHLDDIEYLSDVMVKLIGLHSLKMIFVPLRKINWFNDIEIQNHHPATKLAYDKLKHFIGKEDYSEGLLLSSKTELKEFLPIYFELVGGNYISHGFFYSEELKTVFSYHYSGELWFYCLSKNGLKCIEDFVQSKQLTKNERYTTYNTV